MTLLISLSVLVIISIGLNIVLWVNYLKQDKFIKQTFESYILETKETGKRVEILAKILVQYEAVLKVLEAKKANPILPR